MVSLSRTLCWTNLLRRVCRVRRRDGHHAGAGRAVDTTRQAHEVLGHRWGNWTVTGAGQLRSSRSLQDSSIFVPVLNLFRVPARHLMEVDFALAVLAGRGVSALINSANRFARRMRRVKIVGIAVSRTHAVNGNAGTAGQLHARERSAVRVSCARQNSSCRLCFPCLAPGPSIGLRAAAAPPLFSC